jgi:hypothetical protein
MMGGSDYRGRLKSIHFKNSLVFIEKTNSTNCFKSFELVSNPRYQSTVS